MNAKSAIFSTETIAVIFFVALVAAGQPLSVSDWPWDSPRIKAASLSVNDGSWTAVGTASHSGDDWPWD